MDLNYLREIINSRNFEEIQINQVHLIETNDNSSLKKVLISKLPDNTIVLKADLFDLNTIFGGNKDYNKRCDYLIIQDNTITFIELKSHKDAPVKKRDLVISQFKTVECILDLIDSVIRKFNLSNVNFQFSRMSKKFFLLYHNPSIAKTRTSLKSSFTGFDNNSAEKFHSIAVKNGEEIYFQELF